MSSTGYATLDDWMNRAAIPFTLDSPVTVDVAVDRMIASLGDSVELLGYGEALHGGEDLLVLRNRIFERLAVAHGYSAIAIESSLPQARLVNDYVAGRGPSSYEDVAEPGFGHGFGRLAGNRTLVEWMRRFNADPSRPGELLFYGFDLPASAAGVAGPRVVLEFAIDFLASIDTTTGEDHRRRIDSLLAADSEWENPAIYTDPTRSPGLSPDAAALRIATEGLMTELRVRQPELIAASDESRFVEALHSAVIARQLLNYHAAVADNAGIARLLGIRDALMADNLSHIVERERTRGKVFVFAHNAHLQRGKIAVWPSWQKALGCEPFHWWPAGAHLDAWFGSRYAVIGSAIGVSEANGIVTPEAGTLERRLTALPGEARFLPTFHATGLPVAEIDALPVRSDSARNLSYTPLSPRSFMDFDALAVLNATAGNALSPPAK